MTNIVETKRIELPSQRNGWKRKVRKQFNWSLLVLAFIVLLVFKFIVEPLVVPERAGAVQFKTEADYEREICADLGKYGNGKEFVEYCKRYD